MKVCFCSRQPPQGSKPFRVQETNSRLTNRAQHQKQHKHNWGTATKVHKYTSSLAGHRGTAHDQRTAHTSRAELSTRAQLRNRAQETHSTDIRLTQSRQSHTAHTDTAEREKQDSAVGLALLPCQGFG